MKRIITFFLLFVGLNGYKANSQSNLTKVSGLVFSGNKLIGHEPGVNGEDDYYEYWTEEKLSGNNKPFQSVRLSIRNLNKTPGLLKKKIVGFKREARDKPYDAVAQFRWVLADWVEHNYKNSPVREWRDALYRPLSPKSYDYTRLRFLVTAQAAYGKYISDERMKTLGQRLMKVDPKDRFVAYWLRQMKGSSLSVEDKWDNVRYARAQVKANPKDADAQASLGGAYMNLWAVTRSRSHGNMALASYKRYMQMAPPSASFRKHAQFWIDAIPKDQDRWDKRGIGRP